MAPLSVWTDGETVDHLVWDFYKWKRDNLMRFFNGQAELRYESIVYYYLGEYHSVIERLRYFKRDTSAMEREFGQLLEGFKVFRDNKGREFSDRVARDLRRIVSEHLRWIGVFENSVARYKKITDAWDETEIEMGLFELREWFEYARMGIEDTQEEISLDDLRSSIEEYDAKFRELVPIVSKQCSERGHIIQRPDRYPPAFWWRKMAWDAVS
jgi:hypothetical protein